MRFLTITFIAISFVFSSSAWASSVDEIMQVELPATAEVYFQTSETRYVRGNVTTPASLTKLWTVYSGLSSFASKNPFQIQVSWKESKSNSSTISSVKIVSNGSPELDIRQLIQLFQSNGVKKIIGGIQIESTKKFEKPKDMREVSDSGYCYNATVDVVNFNRNCVILQINAEGGKSRDPDLTAKIVTDTKLDQPYNGTRPHFRWLNKDKSEFEYAIKVWLKNTNSQTTVEVLVPNTKVWIQNKITRSLKESGIQFESISSQSDFTIEQNHSIEEKGVQESMCKTIQDSVNVYAQSIYNVLSLETASALPSQFVGARIVDGAGLSKENQIEGSTLFELTQEIGQSQYFEFFKGCLPRAGESGTLDDRLKSFKGRIIAKTGSLNGYSNLAGFYLKDGKWNPFVFMLKDENMKLRDLRTLQDKILTQILK